VPALCGLRQTPNGQLISVQAIGFSFPERTQTGLAPVMVETPILEFGFAVDKEKQVYPNRLFDSVVLLKGSGWPGGRAETKQPISPERAARQLEQTKQGRVLFYREADLRPGHYRLEAIALYDALTRSRQASFASSQSSENRTEADGRQYAASEQCRESSKGAEQTKAADEQRGNPFPRR